MLAGTTPCHALMLRSDNLNAPTVVVTTSPFRMDWSADPLSGSYHANIDEPTTEMVAQITASACSREASS
jgi:hypothetical protein